LRVFTLEDVKYAKGDDFVLGPIRWGVDERRVSTILGPSGSGKTSLLRLLNRLDDPSSGRICYGDIPIASMDVRVLRKEVGMVFQRPELFPGTVRHNLEFGPSLHGAMADVSEILSVVGLADRMLDRDVGTLSGGEAQKVSIGRAISVGPQVLLLDEPTSGLDPTSTLQIENLVRGLVGRLGLTCVFVTHDVAQARRVGDCAILIIDGKKVEEGPMEQVLGNPRDPRTAKFIRGELE
jgi:putative ABC transport system ATP-binding protein